MSKKSSSTVSLTPDEVIALHLLFKVTPFKDTLHRLYDHVPHESAYPAVRQIYDVASKLRKHIQPELL